MPRRPGPDATAPLGGWVIKVTAAKTPRDAALAALPQICAAGAAMVGAVILWLAALVAFRVQRALNGLAHDING